MIPYYIILGIVVFLASFLSDSPEAKRKNENFLIIIIYIVLVLFAGLRDSFVGSDTNNYVYFFTKNASSHLFEFKGSYELGFSILSNIAKNISNQYWSLLSVISALAVFLNLRTLRNLSKEFKVSLFLYLCLGLYVFFFNGARQGLAIAFFGMAIVAAYQGSLKIYIFWILIACLFHKTAIIGVVLYYFLRHGFTFKNIAVNVILFSGVFFLITNVLNLEGTEFEKYEDYIDRGALGGGGYTFYHTAMLGFFIIIRNKIPMIKRQEYDFFLNLIIIGTLIFLFTFTFGLDVNIMRLSFYFIFGHIFIWPIVFQEVSFTRDIVFRIFFVVAHLFYFYMILSQSKLSLYLFNYEIFLSQYAF